MYQGVKPYKNFAFYIDIYTYVDMKTLKAFRESAGLTQIDLARKAGMASSTIVSIENQTSNPGNDTRRRIEEALGQRINWLENNGLPLEERPGTWEQAESDLRAAILNVTGLQDFEQKQFFIVAKEYLESAQDLMDEAEKESDPPLYLPGLKMSRR